MKKLIGVALCALVLCGCDQQREPKEASYYCLSSEKDNAWGGYFKTLHGFSNVEINGERVDGSPTPNGYMFSHYAENESASISTRYMVEKINHPYLMGTIALVFMPFRADLTFNQVLNIYSAI